MCNQDRMRHENPNEVMTRSIIVLLSTLKLLRAKSKQNYPEQLCVCLYLFFSLSWFLLFNLLKSPSKSHPTFIFLCQSVNLNIWMNETNIEAWLILNLIILINSKKLQYAFTSAIIHFRHRKKKRVHRFTITYRVYRR